MTAARARNIATREPALTSRSPACRASERQGWHHDAVFRHTQRHERRYYWGASLASSVTTSFSVEVGTQGLTTPTKRVAIDMISVDMGTVAVLPEPSEGLALLGGGISLLGLIRRRRV